MEEWARAVGTRTFMDLEQASERRRGICCSSAEQRVVTILGDDEAGSLALVAVWSGTVWHRCLGDLE